MKAEVAEFVHHVFDSKSISTESFIDTNNNALNITQMLQHPRLEALVVFRTVWNLLFKVFPSYSITRSYFENNETVAKETMHPFATNIVPHFKFMGVTMDALGIVITSCAQQIASNPEMIKQDIITKMTHRFVGKRPPSLEKQPPSIYKIFIDMYRSTKDEWDGLVGVSNPITRRVLQLPQMEHCSFFDAALDKCCRDAHMFLMLAGSMVVHIDEAAGVEFVTKSMVEYIIEASQASKGHKKIVLLADQRLHIKRTRTCNVYCLQLIKGVDMSLLLPSVAECCVYVGGGQPLPICNNAEIITLNPSSLTDVCPGSCVKSIPFLALWLRHQMTAKQAMVAPHVNFALAYHAIAGELVENALAAPIDTAVNAVVFLDNRPNIMTAVAVKITLANLEKGKWAVVGFINETDLGFYRKWLGDSATFVTDPEFVLANECFSLEFYNDMLKRPSFWESLERFQRVLMVQDDGFIVMPGIERKFCKFDYVGAPWCKNMPYNNYLLNYPEKSLVGNGGLSLRNPKVMREICAQEPIARELVHFDHMQVEPEDVFFARQCTRLGYAVASYEEAQAFASEEVMCMESLGFHKVWGYHAPHLVQQFLDRKLTDIKDIVGKQ